MHEIGELGASVLRAVKADLDPTGVLNPGVLHPVSPQDTRSFTFLVNPASGGGAAPAAVVPVARILRDAGAEVDVTYSPGPRAMGALVAAAVAKGDVVVSVGGDGMLSSLAGLVSAAGGTLGVVPAGRGNDFARMLGLPSDPAEVAALLLERRGAPGRPDLAHAARRGAAARGRLGLLRRRRPRRRDRRPLAVAAAQGCSTRGPRSARSRRTPRPATWSRSTATSGSTPPRTSWSPTPPTTAPA